MLPQEVLVGGSGTLHGLGTAFNLPFLMFLNCAFSTMTPALQLSPSCNCACPALDPCWAPAEIKAAQQDNGTFQQDPVSKQQVCIHVAVVNQELLRFMLLMSMWPDLLLLTFCNTSLWCCCVLAAAFQIPEC